MTGVMSRVVKSGRLHMACQRHKAKADHPAKKGCRQAGNAGFRRCKNGGFGGHLFLLSVAPDGWIINVILGRSPGSRVNARKARLPPAEAEVASWASAHRLQSRGRLRHSQGRHHRIPFFADHDRQHQVRISKLSRTGKATTIKRSPCYSKRADQRRNR